MGTEEVNSESDMNLEHLLSAYDQWFALPVSGLRPSGRYKHAAEVVDEKIFVVGGSRNGRHLNDIQIFDLRTWKWSVMKPNPGSDVDKLEGSLQTLPASSGHSLVKWGDKLYNVAGHLKESSKFVTVRSIDIETHCCHVLETTGNIPRARGGQSVSIVGSKLIMFGGEGTDRQLLNDVHILDLETMIWRVVETTQSPPTPRFDHIAAVYVERYLLIFGGSSHSTCFSDLHILDLQAMEWCQPEILGEVVSARAGHAGAAIGENWYIVGGGDNKSGAIETLVLNVSTLVWSVVTSAKGREPIASEGLSLCATSVDGINLLIAFGGYNGNYHNEVLVMKPKPRELLQPKILQSPAAAAAAASVKAAYALTTAASKNLEFVNGTYAENVVVDDSGVLKEEMQALKPKLAEVRLENSRLTENLDEINNTHADLVKELQSVHGQVAAERSRCFKLEVQIADLQGKLESLNSIEHELEVLRHQKSALEHVTVEDDPKSGGVWQWLGGTNR